MTQKEKISDLQLGSLTDKEIIDKILETGETELFGELYDRYANKVYRKSISMVKERALAQDLTHDILIKAFLNLSKLNLKAASQPGCTS